MSVPRRLLHSLRVAAVAGTIRAAVPCCLIMIAAGIAGFAGAVGFAGISKVPAAAAASSSWQWPLRDDSTPSVLRPFDPPPVPWEPGHRGVDLEAQPGQPVFAAGDGRVLYAGMLAGRGVVSIAHGAIRTTYEPVISSVHAGQKVVAGERIGVVGEAPGHCAPRTCLHWGLLRGEVYLDPLGLLGRGPVRLLPIWEMPASARCALPSCAATPSSRARMGLPISGAQPVHGHMGVDLSRRE